MFGNEIAINEFLSQQLEKVANDIPEDDFFPPSIGHGHPPVWILGHLAIVAEMGQRTLGGTISHPAWLRLFGPGSSDIVSPNDEFTKPGMISCVIENYRKFRELAATVDELVVRKPHNVSFFAGTSIKTVEQCMSHLLTSHFALHLAQLSSCRRAAGFGPIF